MSNEIPESILKRHPNLLQIHKAIEEYIDGKEITAVCTKCNKLLMVEDIPEVGSLWVSCGNGCTNYRSSSYKKRDPLNVQKATHTKPDDPNGHTD